MGGKRGPLHQDHGAFFAALGRRIKELRKERGWSLHHMVARHGYYQSQWQSYEKGQTVTVDSLLKMAEMFGLSLRELIDPLGQFPSKNMETVAENPSIPKPIEQTMSKAASKRAKSKPSGLDGKGVVDVEASSRTRRAAESRAKI